MNRIKETDNMGVLANSSIHIIIRITRLVQGFLNDS